MGLGQWLRKIFSGRNQSQEMVPFFDVPSGRIVRIPVSELRSGVVQVRLQGTNEIVWAIPDQLHEGNLKHPEFEEEIRAYIRQIQSAFAEHRLLSFEEWEDGFRRDADPAREIAFWSHAAEVYLEFANQEPSPARRDEVYRCIVACLTTGPADVWKVLRTKALSRTEADKIVNRFFRK